jgi:hypothetical protein
MLCRSDGVPSALRRLEVGCGAALIYRAARGRPSNNRIGAGVRDYALTLRSAGEALRPTRCLRACGQSHREGNMSEAIDRDRLNPQVVIRGSTVTRHKTAA